LAEVEQDQSKRSELQHHCH